MIESSLIIFNVVLALLLAEWIAKIHDRQETSQVVEDLRAKLSNNEKMVQEQYAYHQLVLRNMIVCQELVWKISSLTNIYQDQEIMRREVEVQRYF